MLGDFLPMTTRLLTVGLVTVLALAGCTSGGSDKTAQKEDAIEAFEGRSSDPGALPCGKSGPVTVRLYRSKDGSFGWVDGGGDGTIDAITAEGNVYFIDPTPPVGPAPTRWIKVPAGLADPLSYFAWGMAPWNRLQAAFDMSDDPLHEFQALQDKGDKSPAPVFPDQPDAGTATWSTNDDGRVVELSVKFPPEAGSGTQSMRLLPPSEVMARPEVPVDAAPFEDEPLAHFLPRSVMIDPACGETTESQLATAQPCLDAATAEQTVGDWVKAHDKQSSLYLPAGCA